MARTSRYNHALELTLFLWHMPDDATEGVAEHNSRLQPSINLHAPVTASPALPLPFPSPSPPPPTNS